ncbi:MAG: S8 family serine peptidase, partial [Geodermatophilales bacterium]|nr:S8 family serine peptidase [Geodermatophilales bacterium]
MGRVGELRRRTRDRPGRSAPTRVPGTARGTGESSRLIRAHAPACAGRARAVCALHGGAGSASGWVKVGASDGAVDVSQVIAGIDWVVQHAGDNHTRVINLSYGTDSMQSSMVDPLALAVENAWKHGIVVVAAGGNDG